MTKILRYCSHAGAVLFLTGLLTACGSNGSTSNPTVVSSTTPATFYAHSIAFRNQSTMTWGYNGFGQLGYGVNANSAVPTVVPGLSGVIGGAVGGTHTVVFQNISGTTVGVKTWGNNGFGQLGDGATTARTTPVRVNNLSGVTAVAAGGNHTLARKSDGTVAAWGHNGFGQLGVASTSTPSGYATTPQQVSGGVSGSPLAQVTQIAAGGSHSLAIDSSNQVWGWGYNAFGQVGDGTTLNTSTPKPIPGFSVQVGVTTGTPAVVAGGSHSVVLKSDGTVWGWGYNGLGQLGADKTLFPSIPAPRQVPISGTVTAIAAGLDHTLALLADGTVWAWGFNGLGQLGNNTIVDNSTPAQVQILTGATLTPLTGITRIFAVGHHNLAVKNDGTVWAWGNNTSGQLGIATAATPNGYSPVAVQVPGLTGAALLSWP